MKERKNGVRKTTYITRSATYHTGKIITCYAGKIDCDMMYSIPVLQTVVFPPARTIAVGELHSGTVCRSVSQCVAVRCSVSTLVEWRCSRWPRHLYCCTHTSYCCTHTHCTHTHSKNLLRALSASCGSLKCQDSLQKERFGCRVLLHMRPNLSWVFTEKT